MNFSKKSRKFVSVVSKLRRQEFEEKKTCGEERFVSFSFELIKKCNGKMKVK